MGCDWAYRTYGLAPWLHQLDVPLLARAAEQSLMFGVPLAPVPKPAGYLVPGNPVPVGTLELEVLFTPGHAPGHVVFYHRASQQLIAGDVLFAGSIGRTDLPGGSLKVLMESVFQVMLPLGDAVKVYPGHGPATTIGRERVSNPFLQ
jgi:hydroxyacylglutathione hydrolase